MLKRKPSLSQYFLLATTVIVVAAFLFPFGFYYTVYTKQNVEIESTLGSQASRVERTLTDSFDYTAHMMTYMGNQILENGKGKNLIYIRNLLRSFRVDQQVNNLLSWSTYMWANEKQKIVVEGVEGVLDSPRDLSHRDYIPSTITTPGKLQLGQPTYGKVSGQWIIPGGVGVAENGHFYGTVAMGFNIKSLIHKLEQVINVQGISLALYDLDNIMIARSENSLDEDNHLVINALPRLTHAQSGLLSRTSFSDFNAPFIYYYKLSKYPFIIVLKYDKAITDKMLWYDLIMRIIEFSVGSFILVASLVLFRYSLVKPIVLLGNAAEKINKGDADVTLPSTGAEEVMLLSSQLQKLADLYTLERNNSTIYKDYLNLATSSETEKRDFIRKINHELKNSLNFLIPAIETLLGESDGNNSSQFSKNLTPDGKRELLKNMLQAALYIKYRINTITSITSIDVHTIIQKSVRLLGLRLLIEEITIYYDTAQALPEFLTDEVRFRQIIVALICRSVEYHSKGGNIWITASIGSSQERKSLVLTFRDDAPGLPEAHRKRLETKCDNDVLVRSDGIDLEFEAIQMLVFLLKGELTAHSEYGKQGNITVITLPYLTQEDFEPSTDKPVSPPNVLPFNKYPPLNKK